MVKRRDLNAPPGRRMAETVRLLKLAQQQSKTSASGVKDFGETGDAVWTNPITGNQTSVREIPPQIEEAKESIAAAEEDIQAAKDAIAAEVLARQEQLADALDQLALLEGKLDGAPTSAELEAVRQQVATAQEAVQAAQADATAAQEAVAGAAQAAADAQADADTANANALAAAGIAADKGRIFYQATEPTGDDRSPNNLWIDSDNGKVHVWNGTAWEESQSEDLRDAAQAAVAAQQAAEAADQKAQDAAAAAAAADAKAQAAQGAAEAAQQAAADAQQTADDAVLDARDAHNEAVAAQEVADEAKRVLASGVNLVRDPTLTKSTEGWSPNTGGAAVLSIEDHDMGKGVIPALKHQNTGHTTIYSEYFDIDPTMAYEFRLTFHKPEANLNATSDFYFGINASLPNGLLREVEYVRTSDRKVAATGSNFYFWYEKGPWEAPQELVGYVLPQGVSDEAAGGIGNGIYNARLLDPNTSRMRVRFLNYANDTLNLPVWVSNVSVRAVSVDDILRAHAAQAAADAAAQAAEEARQLAESKPDMDDVQQAITVSANGKNAITVSTSAPTSSTPGAVLGDTWWQVNAAGDIFGQWMWNGTWRARAIRSEVIANLDVGKLTVTGTSRFTEAVVDRLFADIFTAHKITANEITIAALDAEGNLEPGSVRGVHIGDGQVSANKITIVGDPNDPDEVGLIANIAAIMKLAVENLVVTEGAEISEAVILKLAAEMITSGVLRTAETGQRVVIDTSGIVMYGVGVDGEDVELVRIGPSGENLITIGGTTVSADSVQSPRGSFDNLQVGGDTLDDILAQLPRGMRAWGELTQSSSMDSDASRPARRAELQTVLEPQRLYKISVNSHYLNTSATTARAVEELRYSFDYTPIYPTTDPGSGTTRGAHARHYLYGNSVYTVPGLDFMLDTGNWNESHPFWLMLLVKTEGNTWPVQITARADYPVVLMVEDVGPTKAGLIKRWNDNNGGATQDPDPVVVRRTDTWGAGGYGGDVKNGTVYQGTYSSYGNRYGGWIFSSAMRSALSGSTIEKIEVYLENAHWYYGSGGTAVIYPNNGSYKGIVGSGITSPNWPRYAGRWVTLPSSWYASIVNGTYKGVSTYTTNTGLTYYGQFKGSPTKFRATYRK